MSSDSSFAKLLFAFIALNDPVGSNDFLCVTVKWDKNSIYLFSLEYSALFMKTTVWKITVI